MSTVDEKNTQTLMLMQRQKSSMLLKPPPLTMQTDQPKDKHEGGWWGGDVRKKKIKWNIYWETCSSGQLLWFHLESKDSSLHPKYHRNASAEIPLGFNGRSCVKWQLHSVRTLSRQERAMLECTNAKGRGKKSNTQHLYRHYLCWLVAHWKPAR